MNQIPDRDSVFTAIDIETTGLHPFHSEIVEIAAVKFKFNGRIDSELTQLINPMKKIPLKAREIHGIDDSMVAGKHIWSEVAPYFYEFINNSVLVAHNAPFDLSFLTFKGTVIQNPFPDHYVADTLTIAREIYKGFEKFTLMSLSEQLGFEMDQAHRALPDARACAQLIMAAYNEYGSSWDDFAGNFITHSAAWQTLENIPEEFMPLIECCKNGVDITMSYTDSEGVESIRQVTPIQLNRIRQIPYLFGHCQLRNAGRNFRLERIKSWKTIE